MSFKQEKSKISLEGHNLKQHLEKLKQVNEVWRKMDEKLSLPEQNLDTDLKEEEIKELENQVVQSLLELNFSSNDLDEEDLEVINNYLTWGDYVNLQKQIARKAGIEFRNIVEHPNNPTHSSGAAKQILKELKNKREEENNQLLN